MYQKFIAEKLLKHISLKTWNGGKLFGKMNLAAAVHYLKIWTFRSNDGSNIEDQEFVKAMLMQLDGSFTSQGTLFILAVYSI